MGTDMIKVDVNDLKQLILEVQLIKNILISEGEFTDWARNELREARNVPDSELLSSEEVKQMILAK